jgi:hypothetical protein
VENKGSAGSTLRQRRSLLSNSDPPLKLRQVGRRARPGSRRSSARGVQIGLVLCLAIAGIVAVPADEVFSIAERAIQNLSAVRLSDSGAWITPSDGPAPPPKAANASQLADVAPPPIAAEQEIELRAPSGSVPLSRSRRPPMRPPCSNRRRRTTGLS